MKNNILLILAVTVISIGIIVATVLISGGSGDERSFSDSAPRQSTSATAADTIVQPTEETPLAPIPEETTAAPEETVPPEASDEVSYDSAAAEGIISTAHSLIGIDFAEGGENPDMGFDNSGFIYYVLRENGYITCPRGLKAQSEMGAALSFDELKQGDLVFFNGEGTSEVSFGGIYCGNGIMIACLMPDTQVKEINITSAYYVEHFANGIGIT